MSHRSPRTRKAKQALGRNSENYASAPDRPRPLRVVPPDGHMPARPRPLAGGHADTQVMDAVIEADAKIGIYHHLPKTSPTDLPTVHPGTTFNLGSSHLRPAQQLDVTQVLPVVEVPQSAVDAAATQQLPAAVALPPSVARHVDPARVYYERTFVEDDGMDPESRGRHVLAELKALPDPSEELAAAEQRVVSAMVTGVPQVKNPALRLAVRMFREARDMARVRESRCDQDVARLDKADARIKAFAERWAHDDAHWDRVAAALKAKENASDAGQLTAAYEADGTAAALYKVDELSQVIVERARAKAGVR